MRKLARYAFDCSTASISNIDISWENILKAVNHWLSRKGRHSDEDKAGIIHLSDGREATLRTTSAVTPTGELTSWQLLEPIEGGQFKTTISTARNEQVLAVSCELEAGSPDQVLAPVFFRAHCPHVIRSIIDIDLPWCVKGFPISTKCQRFSGDSGGTELTDLIKSESRSLPLVVISEFDQFVIHPGIGDTIARDLAGLARVSEATAEACWGVTNALGSEWSCYNGAIRLYWPLHAVDNRPINHPLWTTRRLLKWVPNTEEAAERVRKQFRRKIFDLSTLTMARHSIFNDIERAARRQEQENRRSKASSQKEWIEFLEGELESLTSENQILLDKVARYETDLANERVMRDWSSNAGPEEITPDDDVPPVTVDEAVQKARREYEEFLSFGDDVLGKGIKDLDSSAGPPDKVLEYLKGLADCARRKREGNLGYPMIRWLKENGFDASGEASTISKAEKKKRVWHDGTKKRQFEMHLKPNSATSPEKCVRIYFAWDGDSQKIVIGWVGRHP